MSSADQKTTLIDELTQGLKPVERIPGTKRRFLFWAALSAITVAIPFLLGGPFRANSIQQFFSSTYFQVELFLGISFICLGGYFALEMSVPGRSLRAAQLILLSTPLLLLIGLTVYGISHPPFPLTMEGKRSHCVFEVFLYGLVPFLTLFYSARRAAPMQRRWIGFLIATAAFLPAGLIMQFACMYDPAHALKFHYGPVIVMGLIGLALGRLLKTL